MTPDVTREGLKARVAALIRSLPDGAQDTEARDTLLCELARYQTAHIAAYRHFASQRPGRGEGVNGVAALPTDAFRFARIHSAVARANEHVFESSGTTNEARSQHVFHDFDLYDLAAETAARAMLFPDVERMRLLIIAPSAADLATSSLSYMLQRFITWFGAERSRHVFPVAGADVQALVQALSEDAAPVALLGTSFALVHAMDALGTRRFSLPMGSRIMQTGGFKGRAREIAPAEMRAWLSRTFGVPESMIVAEYGMTELSSQLYESTLRDAILGKSMGPRRLLAPGWVRAVAVHPETLLPVSEGERGLVRIDDTANLDSVAAIQTADLALFSAGGLVLEGRASGAVARGCSLTADDLLSRGGG